MKIGKLAARAAEALGSRLRGAPLHEHTPAVQDPPVDPGGNGSSSHRKGRGTETPVVVITDRSVAAPNVRCVKWSDVAAGAAALDPDAHVVVEPAEGTDHLQANLARSLDRDRAPGRFVLWVLTSNVNPSAVGFGLDWLVEPVVGEVQSSLAALRGASLRVQCRVRPGRGVVPVCVLRTEKDVAVAGAADPSRCVLAVPAGAPADQYVKAVREAAATRRSWTIGLHSAAAALVVLFAVLVVAGRAERSRRVVDLTLTADRGVFWVPEPSADETWHSAEAHMADRVLRHHLADLAEVAGGPVAPGRLDALAVRLDSAGDDPEGGYESPVDTWPAAKVPFYLALLRGDVAASYAVVRAAPSARDSPRAWLSALNGTYWQTAVESLYELQFDKAVAYAELYAGAAHHVVQQAQYAENLPDPYTGNEDTEWESGLVGERNRTLAQILLREARAGRLGPLCADPNRALGFAYVLPRGGGAPITARTARALAERRALHRPAACGPRSRYAGRGPDFSLLPRMQELRSAASLSREDFEITLAEPRYAAACREFPLECQFSRVVANLKSPPSAALDSALTAAVRFAGSCTYVSDDALYFALRRSQGLLPGSSSYQGIRERRRAPRGEDYDMGWLPVSPGGLPARALPASITPGLLGAALGCVTASRSDFYPTLARLADKIPCERLRPLPVAADSTSLLRRESARCHP